MCDVSRAAASSPRRPSTPNVTTESHSFSSISVGSKSRVSEGVSAWQQGRTKASVDENNIKTREKVPGGA